jgi:hypothetical protein
LAAPDGTLLLIGYSIAFGGVQRFFYAASSGRSTSVTNWTSSEPSDTSFAAIAVIRAKEVVVRGQILLERIALGRTQLRSSSTPVRQRMRVARLAPPSHNAFDPAQTDSEDLGQAGLAGLVGVHRSEYLLA